MKLVYALLTSLLTLGLLVDIAYAGDVSLAKGFYQQSKEKDGLEAATLSLGGRYTERFQDNLSAVLQLDLASTSYAAPDNTPDDRFDYSILGGARLSIDPIADGVTPYVQGLVGYTKETTTPSWTVANASWLETSGLSYEGFVGARFDFGALYFIDVETSIFKNYLYAKELNHAKTPTGSAEAETTRVDLFVDSVADLSDIAINIGIKL